MHIIDVFDRGLRCNPDAICFIQDQRRYSYREIDDLTRRIAQGLFASGLSPGAHGAVLSTNHPLAFACTLALWRAEMVWITLNARDTVQEIVTILNQLDCDILFYHSTFSQWMATFRTQATHVKIFICIDQQDEDFPALTQWAEHYAPTTFDPSPDPDTLVTLQTTGGSTGLPKGVMHSSRSLLAMVDQHLACMDYQGEPPVYLAAAPLTHTAGFLVPAILALGGTTVVLSRVNPREMLQAVAQYQVTTFFLPPTAIYSMLAVPHLTDYDLSSLKFFVYGASPMSPDKLQETVAVFGPVMLQVYGQQETEFPLTYLSPADHYENGSVASRQRLMSCGRQAPLVEVAIMDGEGCIVPANHVGEIVARGATMMRGYYKNPSLTAQTWAHGWVHTGDLGYQDEDGYFYIVDRVKDMIVTGGFNVYSSQVENVLLAHPAIHNCAVIGVPDEQWGEAVKAVVELKPGYTVSEEELIQFCKKQLGGVKTPKSVDFVQTLPRSAVGKILKRELRAPYWADRERQV
ncbi:MAG: long-chain fatty acid--CoA ligase [Sulfobacillus benefaciens]|uniref:Long-chain fatty acid--CoA ligase n=1 Tax=Sulfobacillus benefaciens TaxID=453960 RepID=A0A2T2XCX7_9FIRM|nr:MAG: long-chain fatty acid--CoA ligase [Sulfobacillus benefaciens]